MTPALRERFDDHRGERQAELYELAALLETYNMTPDAGPVRDAASSCLARARTVPPELPDAGRLFWGYRIDGLRMKLAPQRHCRPRRAEVREMVGVLSVTVEEYLPDNIDQVGLNYDHIRTLGAEFSCDAKIDVDGESHDLRAAWHVDTHLYTETSSDSLHPRFHFQVGGEAFDEFDDRIRGVLLPETPRLACAPLDGILAIDFVLSHYCGEIWDDLRLMDGRYGRVRSPAMQRYWAPYYQLISHALASADPVPFTSPAGILLPNLATN